MKAAFHVGKALGCALLVFTLLASMSSEAMAQERSGLMGGLSLGAGTLAFGGASPDPAVGVVRQEDDQRVDLGINMYLGASVTPRTTLLFEGAFARSRTEPVDGEVRVGPRRVTFSASTNSYASLVFAGAAQYWIVPNLWLRGGIGAGLLDREMALEDVSLTITLEKGTGFATLAAAGIEVWHRGDFALDAEFHFTSFAVEGLRINAPSVHVGFTWY